MFGQLNNNNSNNVFGANKPATGFGSGTSGGLFGQLNQLQSNQGGGLFGQNNSNQQSGGGLFGSKPAATGTTSAFGQNNTGGLFGGGNQQNNTSGGLFGSKPAGTTGGGLFGNNTQQGTSGGLFGQQQQQPQSSGGGLFGSKPAGSTGGGLFGGQLNTLGSSGGLFGGGNQNQQQQNSNAFGSGSSAGGLFGSKPGVGGATGGLFGSGGQQQSTASGATGGGLFGGGSSSTSGGLFGSKPAQNGIGTGTGTGGLFGGGNNTNNNNNNNNNNSNNSNTVGGGFGNFAGGLSTSGGFLQQLQPQSSQPLFLQQSQQQQTQPLANINTQNPYGNNPLFQSITGTLQEQGQGQRPQAVIVSSSLSSSNPAKKTVTLGSASLRITPLFKVNVLSAKKPEEKAQDQLFKKKVDNLFSPITDLAIITSDVFKPNINFKKLVIEKSSGEDGKNGQLLVSGTSSPTKQVTFGFESKKKPASSETLESQTKGDSGDKVGSGERENGEEVFDADGYWMSPSLNELKKKSLLELKSVQDFKIGRKNYGTLKFIDPVDLTAMINLEDIPGNLVTFDTKSCVVYPDDDVKPRPGEGLNLPAEITLEGCFPLNSVDKLPILDPKSDVVKRHIENLKKLPEMEFISYDPETGDWKFRVKEM